MHHDSERLAALRHGLTAAHEDGYVAIRVADLKWLLDQIGTVPSARDNNNDTEGDADAPDQE